MAKFSEISKARLKNAHPLIQKVMNEAIKEFDFVVLDSLRDRAHQELAFKTKRSKAHFGQSAHNYVPAIAVDICPLPVNWNKPKPFHDLMQVVMRIAKEMDVPLTWGGDWDGDGDLNDQKLVDLPHYELKPWRTWAKGCKLYGEHK